MKTPLQSLRDDRAVMEDLHELFNNKRRKIDAMESVQDLTQIGHRAIVEFLEEPIGPTESHDPESAYFSEAIVMATGRPSLLIQDGRIQLASLQLPSLRQRLQDNLATIEAPIPSVGRIELLHHPDYEWIGTGWLLADNVLVTNRHVAEVFSEQQGMSYQFRRIFGATIEARVDFLEEHRRADYIEIEIQSILFVSPAGAAHPDIAFLKVKQNNDLPSPLELAVDDAEEQSDVGIIGYPAWDGRRNPGPAMARIFQDIYNVKRYAPGRIADVRDGVFTHDCSTLGGNSGSPVLNQATGKVVGLHFAGRFMSENFAIPMTVIKQQLLRITGSSSVVVGGDDAPLPLESLENREGYSESFLGRGRYRVPFPSLTGDLIDDAAPVKGRERSRGVSKFVLDYTHFSVVMNKKRRLPFFTAVNIDGSQEVLLRRRNTQWKLDPRIDRDHQYGNELYVRNKLDRGHMVRRLDPVWGSDDEAEQADTDTFHYTNCAPQHQDLNQRTWLDLEDYLLQNTTQDDQKLTVFTGPVFTENDTSFRGTTLPHDFWKVAVMVYRNKLRATGYMLSQKEFMDDLEFVIGRFRTYQTPIRVIEQATGISFNGLREFDPLESVESFAFPTINGPADLVL
ncbi:DNA/RNA non-specific endonuclease [Blastopirellula sp. J2-11]|uniref:DNA/RNA non-specific endonuclease n=1 Tax=Blastopirellula sp. J2-11 TaxID=2943192 RepID=UPI0021C8A08F|nr:DNA/RNA non-specific endonuclease [Blastopirellula sp. J2-11]UUO04981.1 DNA/RNA non-specific endonuclease [Blastopirellula sp. J2-11]